MNAEEQVTWEAHTSCYAQRFNWWWRGHGRKRAVARFSLMPLKSLSAGNRERLWTQLRWAAFYYELCARRKHGRKRANRLLYEHGVVFCDLEQPTILNLLTRWPGNFVVKTHTKKRVAKLGLIVDQERPAEIDMTLLYEQRRNDEQVFTRDEAQQTAAIKNMMERRAETRRLLTKEGWSVPRWMRFDLRATNEEISDEFCLWLNGQRTVNGIPEPSRRVNEGKARRTEKAGPPFNQIEAVDLHASLTTSELKQIKLDSANARKHIKKASITWNAVMEQHNKTPEESDD